MTSGAEVSLQHQQHRNREFASDGRGGDARFLARHPGRPTLVTTLRSDLKSNMLLRGRNRVRIFINQGPAPA